MRNRGRDQEKMMIEYCGRLLANVKCGRELAWLIGLDELDSGIYSIVHFSALIRPITITYTHTYIDAFSLVFLPFPPNSKLYHLIHEFSVKKWVGRVKTNRKK